MKIDAKSALREIGIPIKDNTFWFENTSYYPWKLFFGQDRPNPKSRQARTFDCYEGYWEESRLQVKGLLESAVNKIPLPGKSLLDISIRKQILAQLASKHADKFSTLREKMAAIRKHQEQIEESRSRLLAFEDYETTTERAVKKTRKVKFTEFEEENIAPNKVTQCLICKSLCHNPCHLDKVYGQGDLNLRNCAAFQQSSNCQIPQCGHNYSQHSHTQVLLREVFREKEETYTEVEQIKNVDHDKKKTWEVNQAALKDFESLQTVLQEELDEHNSLLQDAFRVMAFLNSMLEELSFTSCNEYFLDYLDYLRDSVTKNQGLSKEEKKVELELLERAQSVYETIKQVGFDNEEQGLSHSLIAELQKDYNQKESHYWEMINTYQENRQCFKLNHGMKLDSTL